MRILKNSRVNALYKQFQTQGSARCPDCSAPVSVLAIPKFLTSGKTDCSTVSVVCKHCGTSGAVELRERLQHAL